MAVFLLLLGLRGLLQNRGGALWFASPEFWIYPAQTILCGALLLLVLARIRVSRGPANRFPDSGWDRWFLASGFLRRLFSALRHASTVSIRKSFPAQPAAYWTTLVFRFLRLVVVVPLVEEIFWRGFVLRYFINEKFHAVPIGAFSWLSFAVVTVGFGFAHSRADWIAALITGALYNCVAYRTKSLARASWPTP